MNRFYVQRHNASRLHYDFRLEIEGVLKSWAVPKGPSLDPDVKHFAALVEDHPLDYGDFEGNIPKGEYGGGSVMLWDRGTFELIGEESAAAQIARGDLKFRLHGEKLRGTWAIVYMKGRGKGGSDKDNAWLLIKKRDEAAETPFDVEALAWSVKTGRTQDEIAADAPGARPMPDFFVPMGATITDKLPTGTDWICEVKWDGIRALVYIERGAMRMYTRNANRCEEKYPELRALPKRIKARQAILDGEIVVLDEKGVSKFELTMRHDKPAHYFAFDLLYLDGRDLRDSPLAERKRLLTDVVKPGAMLRISESFEPSDALLETAKQTGLEGLVAKKTTSKYESRRSVNWLKLKLTNEEEFVIAGYTPGEREIGSLAVGFYEGDDLVYCGNVGTGFDERTLATLQRMLEPLRTTKKPFVKGDRIPKGTIWVKPDLVAQVRFANWTEDRKLRAPVYLGLREDKEPAEVVPENTFTNLNKLYFPEDGITKGELIQYYDTVAPLLLPHLKDRPLSLKRYPNGIHGEYFFQKNTPETYPKWLRTETIEGIRYVLADDKRSLLYLVNLGCIDQNPWMSRAGSLEHPDFILIDLDPQECGYEKIVEAALLVKAKLDAIGLKGYPKTTGGDGMHIYIPIRPEYTYAVARQFAEVISHLLAAERPDLFTTPRAVGKRDKNKVYFDWMQIAESKTISAPYVARAYKGAPVSTPLNWDEVKPGLEPSQFTIRNAPERFARTGDLFADVLRRPQALEKAFGKLEKLIKR